MILSLEEFVDDFADALYKIDQSGKPHKQFQPGIGPYGEAEAVKVALQILHEQKPNKYQSAITKRQPDLLIPDLWQIEFKVVRPYGDNGKEAENWSQNVLHPYPGNTSSISDCLKLMSSQRDERKAIVVFGFEHNPAQISLTPCIQGFEMLAVDLLNIRLGKRIEKKINNLIHPIHQVLRVFAWEVLG